MIYGTPTIVTNGLVLNLDALNSKSIPVDPTVNLALWSQNFSQSIWNKSTYDTITTGSTAPDGTPTATLIDETNAYLDLSTISQPNIIATSPTITYSIYTKKGTATSRSFLLRNNTTLTNFTGLSFQYSISSSAAGWTVQDVGNDWFRLSYTQTTGITPGNIIQIYAGRTGAAASGSTATWYVWGAQVEATSYATPYIISTSTNGRRNTWSDLSGNNNTATLVSSSISGSIPTFPSANNRVLQFNGTSSYCTLGTKNLIQNDFTISIWFKLNSNTLKEHFIFSNNYSTIPALLVTADDQGNGTSILTAYYASSSVTSYVLTSIATPTSPIYNITLTRNGSTNIPYLNGIEQTSRIFTNSTVLGSGLYELGYATIRNKTTAYLQGNIYTTQIYNRALSQQEITQNYNALKSRFGLS